MQEKHQGRGWHGDPEGHAEAARERNKTNWLPLLALPLALFIGWAGHDAMTIENTPQQQYGVGAGPGLQPCTP